MLELTSPAVLKSLLARHGFHFSKSLGQNFLLDKNVLDEIVHAAGIDTDSEVLEIGPGFGTLTQALCSAAGKVAAIEIDSAALPVLEETCAPFDNLTVIHGDVLKLDLKSLIAEQFSGHTVKVAANLPYYITSPILTMLIENELPIQSITVMVQKEVADRLCAAPGGKEYGVLSVAVQFYCTAQTVCIVPPESFMPPPSVDSAVVHLTLRNTPAVEVPDRALFFRVVRAAFALRRKTLLNSLTGSGLLGLSKELIAYALDEAQIAPNRRGETLSLEEFAKLCEIFFKIKEDFKG
ncbi:MAG: 16S rRNA (adenine(1518)-N(6)/adenine(1519)-N(6))-dimethyltransferase RsmA [Ruminococcaceae bacterium]|nr:16S rRNA (adenine(1518)-N(6)/adenine(1519)-N(6))-dimethyltransferase RsmA [Oscillospiraceae bacterium]